VARELRADRATYDRATSKGESMSPSLRQSAVFALAASLLVAPAAFAKDITLPPSGDNQFCSVTQGIGLVRVTVEYSSPNVHAPDGKDRVGHIWGELVPYGLYDLGYNDCKQCPWRGNANENTVFTVSHPVKIEGQPLPAGSYGLFFIAGKDEWTVIFSKNHTSWGAFWYDPAEDQLRVTVKPEACEYHEWLNYDFLDRETDHATLALVWERLRVPIHITVDDMPGLYVENLKQEFRNAQAFKWQNFREAAIYCLTAKAHLDQGLIWADRAVNDPANGVPNLQTVSVLAELQTANGRTEEGAKTMERALAMPDATPIDLHQLARFQQMQGNDALAKRIYFANAKRFPNQWPVNVGLARAYALSGDNKQAIAYMKKAIAQAPDDGTRKNLENVIQQWSAPAGK
jgi:tetratricopeptide (TPR) repeat protein